MGKYFTEFSRECKMGFDEFIQLGGVIAFVAEGNKIRFEINLVAARRNRLTISAKLLRVAVGVRE